MRKKMGDDNFVIGSIILVFIILGIFLILLGITELNIVDDFLLWYPMCLIGLGITMILAPIHVIANHIEDKG